MAVLALPACKKAPPAELADAAPPPSLTAVVDAESPRASDDLWKRATPAADADPLDLARLADAEGAVGLLEGLEEGGATAETALAALPFADDAELALRRLSEIMRLSEGPLVAKVVDAAIGIASRPRTQTEPLDPEGARLCGEAAVALAASAPEAQLRADALSLARLLVERGAVPASKVPADPAGK